jgi:hypothetical protein
LKTYNQTNFFKHTFCEFQQVDDFEFPTKTNYKSKSESMYFYTKEGVYRKSNHWGRVANCRWKLVTNKEYKNQHVVIGFAKWMDFYPINSTKKNYCIAVDFEKKRVKVQPLQDNSTKSTFTFSEAQQRMKQINHLLKEDSWAKYFDLEIEELREKVILELISSTKKITRNKTKFQIK